MRIIHAIAIITLGAVAMIPATGTAQDQQQLPYRTCFVQSDHNARAMARAACDLAAEEAGYAHGVVQPACPGGPNNLAEPCELCKAPNTDYICVGVGKPNN